MYEFQQQLPLPTNPPVSHAPESGASPLAGHRFLLVRPEFVRALGNSVPAAVLVQCLEQLTAQDWAAETREGLLGARLPAGGWARQTHGLLNASATRRALKFLTQSGVVVRQGRSGKGDFYALNRERLAERFAEATPKCDPEIAYGEVLERSSVRRLYPVLVRGGLNDTQALLVSQVEYLLARGRGSRFVKQHGGSDWVELSVSRLGQTWNFPHLSEDRIGENLCRLVERGVLVREQLEASSWRQAYWYRIDRERLQELIDDGLPKIEPYTKSACVQKPEMDDAQIPGVAGVQIPDVAGVQNPVIFSRDCRNGLEKKVESGSRECKSRDNHSRFNPGIGKPPIQQWLNGWLLQELLAAVPQRADRWDRLGADQVARLWAAANSQAAETGRKPVTEFKELLDAAAGISVRNDQVAQQLESNRAATALNRRQLEADTAAYKAMDQAGEAGLPADVDASVCDEVIRRVRALPASEFAAEHSERGLRPCVQQVIDEVVAQHVQQHKACSA